MKYMQNAEGERIAVLKEEFRGIDPETGGEIWEDVVDEAATAVLMAPEARRKRAYVAEADPLRDRAVSYQMEADGWRLEGEEEKALAAEANAAKALREYVAKKAEVRERLPDPLYRLAASGVYHAESCSYASAAGERLTLSGVAAANSGAKPCSRCNPPALP